MCVHMYRCIQVHNVRGSNIAASGSDYGVDDSRILLDAGHKKGDKKETAWWVAELRKEGYSMQNVKDDMKNH